MKGKTKRSFTVSKMVYLLIPVVAGAAIALQNVFYNHIGKDVGVMGTVLTVHLFGLIFATIFFVFTKYTFNDLIRNINWYMIVSGILGVIVVSGMTKSVAVNGLLVTIMLTVTAQLLLGKVIAHFGWFGVTQSPINYLQVIAIFLMIAGVFIYQKS